MIESMRAQGLWALTNELLIVSELLNMMIDRSQSAAETTELSILGMCSEMTHRCQDLVEGLFVIEFPPITDTDKTLAA